MNIMDFYTSAFSLSREELGSELIKNSELVKVEKGKRLIQAGEVQECVGFLVSGIVRGYLLDINGRDITDCFVCRPGSPILASFGLGEKAVISAEALTDCEMLCVPQKLAVRLVQTREKFAMVYIRFLNASIKAHWEMKVMLYQSTAMERYRWFLSAYPGLIEQVKHKHIASFLGMSPVTLSRLRQKDLER